MVTVTEILNKIKPVLINSNKVNPETPLYRSQDQTGEVYIYKVPGLDPPVFIYQSSGAIDCDGVESSRCNGDIDSAYQNDTSFHTSKDTPLNAAELPFYVLPIAGSSYFDYTKNKISGGQLGLLMYGSKMVFAVFGDENADEQSTGEISRAAADALGIPSDPEKGGVESGVTFIIFAGSGNVVNPIENHNLAVSKGNDALSSLLNKLSGGTSNMVNVRGTIQKGKGNIDVYRNGKLVKHICCNQGTYGNVLFNKGDKLKLHMYGYPGWYFRRWCTNPTCTSGNTNGTYETTIGTTNLNFYAFFDPVCDTLSQVETASPDDGALGVAAGIVIGFGLLYLIFRKR